MFRVQTADKNKKLNYLATVFYHSLWFHNYLAKRVYDLIWVANVSPPSPSHLFLLSQGKTNILYTGQLLFHIYNVSFECQAKCGQLNHM